MIMTFEEYLTNKKIDTDLFSKANPEKWQALKAIFEQMHPEGFTMQKKFLLNDLRKRFLWKEK
jgi:hypothetical protein